MARKIKRQNHRKKGLKKQLKRVKSETKIVAPETPDDFKFKKARIKVIGIGDGGGQIVAELAKELKKVDFMVANTDWRGQKRFPRNVKFFPFGEKQTQGVGSGMDPELGRQAALSEKEKITKLFKGADLCFLVACLGGGTSSGAAPVFARIAQQAGVLTLGIFTLPFKFEGEKKIIIAKEALERMKPNLNASLVFPNEKIFQSLDKNISFNEGFSAINKVLSRGLQGLIGIIFQPGLINIDFADLKTILEGRGKAAFLASAEFARGAKLEEIRKRIFQNAFLSYNFRQAKAVLFNIVSDNGLSLNETSEISQQVFNAVHPEAKIIFGVSFDKKLIGKIKVVLLAIGGREKGLNKISDKKLKKPRRKKRPETDTIRAGKGGIEVKIRRNGLQIKEEARVEEETLVAKEKTWETPTILRRGLLKA
jgi:cell division protein FtsZ